MGSLSSVAELLIQAIISQITPESIGELITSGSKSETQPI